MKDRIERFPTDDEHLMQGFVISKLIVNPWRFWADAGRYGVDEE